MREIANFPVKLQHLYKSIIPGTVLKDNGSPLLVVLTDIEFD